MQPRPQLKATEIEPERVPPANGDYSGDRTRPFPILDPITLEGAPVPQRRWVVEGLIPRRATTLMYGDGGVGKSLLGMQLLTATALGKGFLGMPTAPVKAIGYFCEDDRDELHIRQTAINDSYGASFGDLERMRWLPRFGIGGELMYFPERGEPKKSATFTQLQQQIRDFGAQLVVIDSLHDVFVGNENIRTHARMFISALNKLAVDMDGAVVLLAHPSMSGLSSGTGASGSTAWNNACRSRLYLQRDENDEDRRTLTTKKSNYAKVGDKIELIWADGVLARADTGEGRGFISRLALDGKLFDALRKMTLDGADVAADKNARNSLPNRARHLPDFKTYSWAEIANAQERLIEQGKIERFTEGPPTKRRTRVRPI